MLGKFLRDEEGATAIEYSLIAGFIALAIIAAVGMTGQKLVALFEKSHSRVDAVGCDQNVTSRVRTAKPTEIRSASPASSEASSPGSFLPNSWSTHHPVATTRTSRSKLSSL